MTPRRSLMAVAMLALLVWANIALAQPATAPGDVAPPTSTQQGTLPQRAQSLLGLVAFTALAFAIGRLRGARARVPVRTIVWGFALQFAFGAIVLFAPGTLETVQKAIQKLLDFSNAGAEMVFGQTLVKGVARVTDDAAGKGAVS